MGQLLQAADGGLLELHQTVTGTRILHLQLSLALLCSRRKTRHQSRQPTIFISSMFTLSSRKLSFSRVATRWRQRQRNFHSSTLLLNEEEEEH